MLPGRNRHASTRIRISIRARTIVITVVSWNGSLSTWRGNGEMENCCWRWLEERGRCLEGEWKDRDRGWICGGRFPRFVFWRFDECRHWSSPLQWSSDITGRNSIVDSVYKVSGKIMDRGNFCIIGLYCNCKEIIFDVICENLIGNEGIYWCGYPHPTMVEWLMSYWWCWFKRWVERLMICIVVLLLILVKENERNFCIITNVGNNYWTNWFGVGSV